MTEPVRFRFGPLERRGVLVGLRPAQLAVIGAAGLLMMAAVRSLPPAGVMLSAGCGVLLVVATTIVPIGGRTLDEWLPVLARWMSATLTSRTRFISTAPLQDESGAQPVELTGIRVLAGEATGTHAPIGVIHDRRCGTYTAVLRVKARSFALLDEDEKLQRLAGWASILSGLARSGSPIHRMQWLERTIPEPGNELERYARDNLTVSPDSVTARSYLDVVQQAGPTTQDHEVLLAVQVHAARSARAIKAAGAGDLGAFTVLRRAIVGLSSALQGADLVVQGVLTPALLTDRLRSAYDPALVERPRPIGDELPDESSHPGPMGAEEQWSRYRTDSAWHVTYWITEWPRIDVHADFLSPLLLRTEAMRTVAVTMEPVPSVKAVRAIESARTSAAADEELRQRAGFVTTMRRRKEHDSLADHERELADGHGFLRFSGYVTVTAATEEGLHAACGEIEEAAARSLLDVRRLVGQQAQAFTYTLPLCRGLR